MMTGIVGCFWRSWSKPLNSSTGYAMRGACWTTTTPCLTRHQTATFTKRYEPQRCIHTSQQSPTIADITHRHLFQGRFKGMLLSSRVGVLCRTQPGSRGHGEKRRLCLEQLLGQYGYCSGRKVICAWSECNDARPDPEIALDLTPKLLCGHG